MQIYELSARFDRRASFYGKAHVYENGGRKVLRSYNTDVCEIDQNGHFRRYWGGYSQTTVRHVNEFIRQNGLTGGGAAWWNAQEEGAAVLTFMGKNGAFLIYKTRLEEFNSAIKGAEK